MMAITFHDTLLKMKKDGGKNGKWIDTSRNKMKNDDNSEDFYFVTVTCSSLRVVFRTCSRVRFSQ